MYSLLLSSSSLLASLLWWRVARAEDSCTVCEDVHFFLARGNNEPYPGRQGQLVAATCDGLGSCGYEDLIFSALYTDLYCQISYDGAIAGHVQMTQYAEKCPNSKLILAGYSNGGQVAGDVLAGGGGKSFNGCIQPDTPPMDRTTSPGNQIAAVLIVGDVRHTANQSYDFGSGSPYDGWFPRTSEMRANLNQYADIMRNWCVDTDPICAAHRPNPDEESHLDYYDVDSEAMASWIKSVASLTDDSSFTTAIPTSLSGTVQDYATIGTATPSGSVTQDTTWTDFTSTTYTACTATAYSQYASNGTSSTTSSGSSSGTISKTNSPNAAHVTSGRTGVKGAATGTAASNPSPTSTDTGAGSMITIGGGLYVVVMAILAVMFV